MAPKRKHAALFSDSIKKQERGPSKAARSVKDIFASVHAQKSGTGLQPKSLVGRAPVLGRKTDAEEWTTKHAPKSRQHVVVAKKKVQEVEGWLDAALKSAQHGAGAQACCCCCISGPPGSGRMTTISVLAEERGLELAPWSLPVPTLYSELQHLQAGAGAYQSKLKEFQALIDRSKLSALRLRRCTQQQLLPAAASQPTQLLTSSGGTSSQREVVDLCDDSADLDQNHSGSAGTIATGTQRASQTSCSQQGGAGLRAAGKISIVSDFPHAHSREAQLAVQDMLTVLAQSVRHPTIVLVTDTGRGSMTDEAPARLGNGQAYFSMEEMIKKTLEDAGAEMIKFNPITAAAAVKELRRVAKAEKVPVTEDELRALAANSRTDLYNGIQALQLHALSQAVARQARVGASARSTQDKGAAEASKPKQGMRTKDVRENLAGIGDAAGAPRDLGLNMFHALGKILHNKRVDASGAVVRPSAQDWTASQAAAGAATQSGLSGPGDPAQAPEEVVARSGMGAAKLTAFLFENYVDFIDECGIEDAAAATASFSDCIHMIRRHSDLGFCDSWIDPDLGTASPADAAATAVACRGYQWANKHPAHTGWRAHRPPQASMVAYAALDNATELQARATRARCVLDPVRQLASQVVPYARLMRQSMPWHEVRLLLPIKWKRVWQGAMMDVDGGGDGQPLAREGDDAAAGAFDDSEDEIE